MGRSRSAEPTQMRCTTVGQCAKCFATRPAIYSSIGLTSPIGCCGRANAGSVQVDVGTP